MLGFWGVTILLKGSDTSENAIIYQRTFSIPLEQKVVCFKYECFPKIFVHIFIYLFIHSHILFLFPYSKANLTSLLLTVCPQHQLTQILKNRFPFEKGSSGEDVRIHFRQ